MGREAFEDSRLRLQWAQESLADFKRCASGYFQRTPRVVLAEPDPDGIHENHKIRFSKPFPGALTKYAVHAIEDLRAALDLAACDVARLCKLPITDKIHFPFCRTAADFKSRIGSACNGFPKEITDLFASYEPYTGGSELLYAINTLGNNSKHNIIVPVGSFVGSSISFECSDLLTCPVRILDGFASSENEITFAVTQRGFQWKYQAEFSFRIAFGKVGAIKGRDVQANIGAMIKAVGLIVNEIEAESRRLGLIG